MKRYPLWIAVCALATAGAFATGARADQVTSREVTETRTITGTVSEVTPTSQIVVTSGAGSPTTYKLDQRTVFVDESGNVVSYDQVRGQPVKIYVSESTEQPVVVERVVVAKPAARVIETQPAARVIESQPAARVVEPQPAPQVIQRTETRTETTREED